MKGIFWILTAVLVGVVLCRSIGDPDLWWHITVGRWIAAHCAVPHEDLWNMYSHGQTWRAYSWSLELLFALVERAWAEPGLMTLQILLAIVLSVSVCWSFSRLAGHHFPGLVFGAISVLGCFQFFTLRPQILAWVLLALALVFADEIAQKGLSRKRLLVLFVLGCLWANIHLTTVLGLLAISLWSFPGPKRGESFQRSGIACCAFLMGTLCTPYLGAEWLTFFQKVQHPVHFSAISEFQPATIRDPSSVILSLLMLAFTHAVYRRRAIPALNRLLLIGIFIFAGLVTRKFMPFALVSMGALCADWWRRTERSDFNAQQRGDCSNGAGWLTSIHRASPRIITLGCICLAALILASGTLLYRLPILDLDTIPKAAVDFMEEKQLGFPVLNHFNHGGYLMYRRSSPQTGEITYKVTIDGRTNVNPIEIWELYLAASNGTPNWEDYIKRVNPETILWYRNLPLAALLTLSPDWCSVFKSGTKEKGVEVFIRRASFERRREEFVSSDCL